MASRIRNILYPLLLIILSIDCIAQLPTEADLPSHYNILFVGNSLTYSNNLPELVRKEASLRGISLNTAMIAKPNYALIDHWLEGEVQRLISSGDFNYVIVQQGPSSQQEGRQMLFDDGKKYQTLCENSGAKFCYFMVWPSRAYYSSFDGVILNHREAAQANNAILLPVGEQWKAHFDATNSFDYYGSDGFHPSMKGSKVAAAIIIETLFTSH